MNDKEFVVENIRSQYTEVEHKHTELDELKALDAKVKKPANVFGYTYGSIGTVIMGAGMSLVMTDIGAKLGMINTLVPGIIVGILGMAMALTTYPIYKKILNSRKKKYAPQIMELSDRVMKGYSKAQTELGYTTRSYEETIHDEVQWMIAEGLIDGNGVTEKPTLMTNEQIREGGYMEDIIKAMEHEPALPEIDVEKAYETIEENVVDTYRKIEDGVVGGYKKVEQSAVSSFRKVSDFFVKKLFSRAGETVEETRKRLSRK